MGMFSIRANVTVDAGVKDRDAWAVDLVEGSNLSENLKAGWFWATWPDRVELGGLQDFVADFGDVADCQLAAPRTDPLP